MAGKHAVPIQATRTLPSRLGAHVVLTSALGRAGELRWVTTIPKCSRTKVAKGKGRVRVRIPTKVARAVRAARAASSKTISGKVRADKMMSGTIRLSAIGTNRQTARKNKKTPDARLICARGWSSGAFGDARPHTSSESKEPLGALWPCSYSLRPGEGGRLGVDKVPINLANGRPRRACTAATGERHDLTYHAPQLLFGDYR